MRVGRLYTQDAGYLGTNALDLAGPYFSQGALDCRHKRPKGFDAIAEGANQHQPYAVACNVLLDRHVLVHADKRVESLGRASEERPIVRTSWPANSATRSLGICSSSRTRTGHQNAASYLEHSECLLAADGRKLI